MISEVVKWMLQKLEEVGHGGQKITLKTNQEESIMALKRFVITRRAVATMSLDSKVRVSKSNPLRIAII